MSKKINEQTAVDAAKTYAACKAKLLKLDGDRKLKVQPILEKFKEQEVVLLEDVDKCEKVLKDYTEQNREKLLAGAKSVDFRGVKLGYRKARAKLAIIAEGANWDDVLKLAKKHLPDFIVEKQELNKNELLRNVETVGAKLAKVGLEVQQEESFFVK